MKKEKKLRTTFKEDIRCEDCGEMLPAPKYEQREGGYSELVIICSCGAVYTD
jgi:formylmethanofuran dehydrogenase subunit E